MNRVVEVKKKVADKCRKPLLTCHKVAHKTEHPIHLLYFLAVSATAHGAYAYVAVVCLVVGAVMMIPIGWTAMEEKEEEEDDL